MLTGKHKIGDDGLAIEFGDDDSTLVALSRCAFDGRSLLCVDTAELRSLHALLSEHFDNGWMPCGPDRPFPDSGVEVEVTYLFGETIRGNEIYLPGRAMRSVYGTWVNFQLQEMPEIIAWAYPRKPYEPKGQA
jgi:hypothetical protein